MRHARRYVVSSQLWLTLVRAGLCRRFGETKCDPARISERAGRTPVMAAFRIYIDDSKPLTGSGRVSPMCAVHTSFLLTLLTMSNTMGFAKKRVFSKTAVPIFFNQNSLALLQRSLSQSLDAEAKPSWAVQRTTHASSKQVFVN